MAILNWTGKNIAVVIGVWLSLASGLPTQSAAVLAQTYPLQPLDHLPQSALNPSVLPLNGDIVPLDSVTPQNSVTPQDAAPQDTTAVPQFTFTNTLEYEDCLEAIMYFYKNEGEPGQRSQQSRCFADIKQTYRNQKLSKAQSLRLISAANYYATHLLSRGLYPPRGQRARIARDFGFIYEIDMNDKQIKELAAQTQP